MADLPPLTAFGVLIDPSNPVVFIDVASEAAFGKSKPPPEEKGRITIELFAHWSPKMATNVLQLCTGEARKANNPASGPVGYKGSFLYGSVPGREVTGGDVLRGNGTGMPFSIYEGNGPFAADSVTPNATKKAKLNSYPGLVRMVPTTMGTISPDGAPNVGCSFSISCIPPAEMPQTWLEGHWSTVIGRVVGRPGTQDMAHTMALIERCAKDIYTSRRNPNKASESSGLPIVEQCGEIYYMSTTDGLDLEGNSSIHNTSAGVSHNDSLIGAGVLALGGTQRYPTHTNQALPRRHSNHHIVNSKAYAIDSSIEGGLGMDTDDEVQMTITLANDGGSGGDDRRVSPNSPFAPTVAGGEPIEEECHQLHTQQFYAQPSAPLSIVPASYVPLNVPAGLYPPPPFTNLPTELSDRARLMATITTLSTQCQRLAMQVAAYEQRMPFVPVEVLASFDPIIADSHIAKLNGQLAQLSLLREADKFKLAQLEAAIDATNKSNRLLSDRAMHAERELEAERQSQATTEAIHQQGEHWRAEVVRLREAENALTRENHKLQSTAMAEAVRVIDERPMAVNPTPVLSSSHETLRIQRVFLEMDEQAARQDMLLTALFDPLAMAMDAGLAWHLAAEKAMRTSPSIGAEAISSSTATSTDQQNASQQELDTLVAKSDAEAMRHRVLYLEAHVDRIERSLKRERHRTETQAAEHMERLESFATSRSKDRQVMLDTMLPEIEARLRQAYREGLEAGQARAKDESKSLATQAFGSEKRYRKTRGSGTTPKINKEMSPTTPILTLSSHSHSHSHAAEGTNTTTATVAAPSPPIRFSTVGESFSIPTPQTTAKPTVASAVDALGLVDEIGKHSHDTTSPAQPLADGLLPKRLEMRH